MGPRVLVASAVIIAGVLVIVTRRPTPEVEHG
jgi:hypothetical protein